MSIPNYRANFWGAKYVFRAIVIKLARKGRVLFWSDPGVGGGVGGNPGAPGGGDPVGVIMSSMSSNKSTIKVHCAKL